MVRGTAQEMTLMSEAAHQCLTWAVSNKSSSAVITHALEYSIVVIAVWIVLMGLMRTGVIMSADQISSVALMTGV